MMQSGAGNLRNWLLGSVLAMALPILGPSASAASDAPKKPSQSMTAVRHPVHARHVTTAHHVVAAHRVAAAHHAVVANQVVRHVDHTSIHTARMHGMPSRSHVRYAGLSCVPYARSVTGISVAGNAWQWWDHAAGIYSRGSVPEPGSVLAFRANGRMRLGHVAVVTRVVNDREILIEHANWGGRGVTSNVPVVDVSEGNDWTAVRVAFGGNDGFGSVYPTYGFIYDRPDTGRMLTAITSPAPQQALNPAPRDLRPISERHAVAVARTAPSQYDEVAEAPETPPARHGAPFTGDRH